MIYFNVRIKFLAMLRKKDVLLYALASAIPFYKAQGFVAAEKGIWNSEFKTFKGSYMIWKHD